MPPTWILRDLPGVAELEERLRRIEAHPNPEWAPEQDGLREAVDVLSRRLFGFGWGDLYELSDADYRTASDFQLDPETDAEAVAVFASKGWDVTDGGGKPLLTMEQLGMQIAAVANGFMGEAPTPEGIAARSTVAPEAWGASLEDEARKFRSRRRDEPKKPDKGKGGDGRR